MSKKQIFMLMAGLCLVISVNLSASDKKIRAAVYRESETGLSTYGEKGIFDTLKGNSDIEPEYIPEMTPEKLKDFDVLIIIKKGWNKTDYVPENWKENVRNWASEGHGVMAMHETAGCAPNPAKRYYKWDLFPEIGTGYRVIPEREIVMNVGHPITKNAAPNLSIPNQVFRQQYSDYMILTTGKSGTRVGMGITKDEKNKKLVMTHPVILAGLFGKGRVILNGMLTGYDFETGLEKMPSGAERHILIDGVRWLAGRLPEKQEGQSSNFLSVGTVLGESDSIWRQGPDGLVLEKALSSEQLAEINKSFLQPIIEKINPPKLNRNITGLAIGILEGGKSKEYSEALKKIGCSNVKTITVKDIEEGLPEISVLVIAASPLEKKYIPIIKAFLEKGGKLLATENAGYDIENGKYNLTNILHAGIYIDTIGIEYFSLFMPEEFKTKEFDPRRGEWIIDRCRTAFKNGASGMAYFTVTEFLKPQSALLDISGQNSSVLRWNFFEDHKKEIRYVTETAPLWKSGHAPILKSLPLIPQLGYLGPRHTQVRDTDVPAMVEKLKKSGINILTIQFSYIDRFFEEESAKGHVTVLREKILDKFAPELEKKGIQLWVNVIPSRGISTEYCKAHPEECIIDSQGKTVNIICPLRSQKGYELNFKILEKLFEKYPYLSGISLDEPRIEPNHCFCPECKKLFQKMFPGKPMELNSEEFRKLRECIWTTYFVKPYAQFLRKHRPVNGTLMLASPGHHKPMWSMDSYELANSGVQMFANENAQTKSQCQYDEFWAKHELKKIPCNKLTIFQNHPILNEIDISKIGKEAVKTDVFHGGEAIAYITDGTVSYPGIVTADDSSSIYFAFDPLVQEKFLSNSLAWFIENDWHNIPQSMVPIPAGKFKMKLPRKEMTAGRLPDEMLTEEVFVNKFYLNKYEVTNKEYEKFDSVHKRSELSKDDDMPVTNITMLDAKKYCNWRSIQEKLEPVYANDKNMTANLSKNGYRLPTVVEWQKAASGPQDYKYSWGNFWWRSNGRIGMDFASGAVKVGSYFQNFYGLYDMTGNVWEWCEGYEDFPCRQGRICGGDWISDETESRINFYNFLKDNLWRCTIGFRCARNVITEAGK